MRKIILDCGAHLGESTLKFRKILPNINQYEIYMFEPNSFLFSKIDANGLFNTCIKINKAVTNKDGKQVFWGCTKQQDSVGATLERSKATFDKITNEDRIEVETINLESYIVRNFKEDDFIILKLDIEGSEYDVLEQLIESGTIKYINKLYCEFHTQWLDPSFIQRESKLRKNLLKFRLVPEIWDAL